MQKKKKHPIRHILYRADSTSHLENFNLWKHFYTTSALKEIFYQLCKKKGKNMCVRSLCNVCLWVLQGNWCDFHNVFSFFSHCSLQLLISSPAKHANLSRLSFDCFQINTSHFKTVVSISFLIQCGFFKRPQQTVSVPRYHAVKIKKETLLHNDDKVKVDGFEKKRWMTTWTDSCSWLFLSWTTICLTCAKNGLTLLHFLFHFCCANECIFKCK